MKLPDALVERAAKALEWESNCGEMTHAALRRGARAALEAVLSECPVVKVRGRVGEPAMINVSHSMVGNRVALVVLDD